MSRYSRILLTVLALVAGAGLVVIVDRATPVARWVTPFVGSSRTTPTTRSSASPTQTPAAQTVKVVVDARGFWSWALLDTRTGAMSGSEDLSAPGYILSMIKPWFASDFLRQAYAAGRTPTELELTELRAMIRDSDNDATIEIVGLIDRQGSLERLITVCGLTETVPSPDGWGVSTTSARDVARIADCISDGRAAGPFWTGWIQEQMRQVRGTGDFGIRKSMPAEIGNAIPIKNGWLIDGGQWHIGCMAIGGGWTLGILARYPETLGLEHGAEICRQVATQVSTQLLAA